MGWRAPELRVLEARAAATAAAVPARAARAAAFRPRWPGLQSSGLSVRMAAVAAEARVFLEVRRRLQSALLILG